jgi:UDP-perosamine 4-acetyltransferase
MNIVIFGAGENGHQAFHCLRHDSQLRIVGFLDDDKRLLGTEKLGLPVLGGLQDLSRLKIEYGVAGAIAAVGDNHLRARVNKALREAGLAIVRAIHPHVMIESPDAIGEGVILEMGAAVHAGATLGDGVFMGSASMAAHHCVIGEYSILSGGVSLGGGVTIGPFSLIGVGAAIHPHVTIGANVIVGVGAAVVKNVPDNTVVVGVPARPIRTTHPGDPIS